MTLLHSAFDKVQELSDDGVHFSDCNFSPESFDPFLQNCLLKFFHEFSEGQRLKNKLIKRNKAAMFSFLFMCGNFITNSVSTDTKGPLNSTSVEKMLHLSNC